MDVLKTYNKFLMICIISIFLFWSGYFLSNMFFSGLLNKKEITKEYKTIPDLIGKSYVEAEKVAHSEGFVLVAENEVLDKNQLIINQKPKPEVFSRKGDSLVVCLENNSQMEYFPDFRGVSLEEAVILATENGILIRNISYMKSSEEKNRVLAY